jgi:hypothetical protein
MPLRGWMTTEAESREDLLGELGSYGDEER